MFASACLFACLCLGSLQGCSSHDAGVVLLQQSAQKLKSKQTPLPRSDAAPFPSVSLDEVFQRTDAQANLKLTEQNEDMSTKSTEDDQAFSEERERIDVLLAANEQLVTDIIREKETSSNFSAKLHKACGDVLKLTRGFHEFASNLTSLADSVEEKLVDEVQSASAPSLLQIVGMGKASSISSQSASGLSAPSGLHLALADVRSNVETEVQNAFLVHRKVLNAQAVSLEKEQARLEATLVSLRHKNDMLRTKIKKLESFLLGISSSDNDLLTLMDAVSKGASRTNASSLPSMPANILSTLNLPKLEERTSRETDGLTASVPLDTTIEIGRFPQERPSLTKRIFNMSSNLFSVVSQWMKAIWRARYAQASSEERSRRAVVSERVVAKNSSRAVAKAVHALQKLSVLKNVSGKALVAKFDHDGDGLLSAPEFSEAIVTSVIGKRGMTASLTAKVFRSADVSHDGHLDASEMLAITKERGA
eukprot:TRINITY_DN22010_c0_g1_i1.p1 TRINITY_DN22010_c0_g1~~TRINITY_DN22010_c0_g1_i1.p1  ORF type:complete len:478 (-),score=62.84 TRINITY_DN22010_c0_g1_i1:322-1755(-)